VLGEVLVDEVDERRDVAAADRDDVTPSQLRDLVGLAGEEVERLSAGGKTALTPADTRLVVVADASGACGRLVDRAALNARHVLLRDEGWSTAGILRPGRTFEGWSTLSSASGLFVSNHSSISERRKRRRPPIRKPGRSPTSKRS